MEAKDLLNFSSEDWDMIIEGVDSLKNKDFVGEVTMSLFEGIMAPKKGASKEEIDAWEKRKADRELERQSKEEEKKILTKKIELLKSKLIIMRESIK